LRPAICRETEIIRPQAKQAGRVYPARRPDPVRLQKRRPQKTRQKCSAPANDAADRKIISSANAYGIDFTAEDLKNENEFKNPGNFAIYSIWECTFCSAEDRS